MWFTKPFTQKKTKKKNSTIVDAFIASKICQQSESALKIKEMRKKQKINKWMMGYNVYKNQPS